MENSLETITKESLLILNKEELIEKLLKTQKEVFIQHDLLKQTFVKNKELQKKCAELEKQLDESVGEGYSSASTWVSKIVFILKAEDRPLRSVDLIAILERKESTLKNHHNKSKFFSAYLNTSVKYGRIVQQKLSGVRGYFYLLPEWVDEKGNAENSYRAKMV
jgi:hypothetical protein